MKSILIVDDDNINCVLAKSALEDTYRVITARSGKEALAFLETEVPDLILMDIVMPEMNGKEVVRQIKKNKKWFRIPIVFLTAVSNPMTEAECLECGAEDFITKPFVPIVIKSRVNKIMDSQDFRKELEMQLQNETKKSLTDTLTGLYNREYLVNELTNWLENGNSGTLFMIDLDNFKNINDTYGHMTGDKILQKLAEILKTHARDNDIACRLAGDEFVVFYKDLTDKEIVAEKAERIIRMFAEKIGDTEYAGRVSVSIGIRITLGNESFQNLYEQADKSLYFVKNNGKNAYSFFDENESSFDEKVNEINTTANLDSIRRMLLDVPKGDRGALYVDYDEFKKIYDFVVRCVKRKNQKVQIVLFSLNIPKAQQSKITMDTATEVLKSSVISSLRAVDTGTKYGISQYIVILLDTDIENGKYVAERVIKKFYENETIKAADVKLSYDIQTIGRN